LPTLPEALREQFQQRLGLSAYDATPLPASRAMAQYFERVIARLAQIAPAGGDDALRAQAKLAANWVMGDVAAALNRDGLEIGACPVSANQLAALLVRIQDGTVSGKIARDVFGVLWQERPSADDAADQVIESRGLKQISDSGALEKIIDEVLAANPKSVEEFRAGKEKAFNALVGQAMKATRGKANPQQVNEMLRRRLAG
jgi:aspartyl-tRNA(Asn)/glutamyl-tRNA(Gln) amidotransferase subunit B